MSDKDITLKHNNYHTVADASAARRKFCVFCVIFKPNRYYLPHHISMIGPCIGDTMFFVGQKWDTNMLFT
jgi:hypothetical protein